MTARVQIWQRNLKRHDATGGKPARGSAGIDGGQTGVEQIAHGLDIQQEDWDGLVRVQAVLYFSSGPTSSALLCNGVTAGRTTAKNRRMGLVVPGDRALEARLASAPGCRARTARYRHVQHTLLCWQVAGFSLPPYFSTVPRASNIRFSPIPPDLSGCIFPLLSLRCYLDRRNALTAAVRLAPGLCFSSPQGARHPDPHSRTCTSVAAAVASSRRRMRRSKRLALPSACATPRLSSGLTLAWSLSAHLPPLRAVAASPLYLLPPPLPAPLRTPVPLPLLLPPLPELL